MEKIAEENERKKELNPDMEDEPEPDRESLAIRLDTPILYTLLKQRLNENDCKNRGYILDGFPKSYKDCQEIFLKQIP